MDGLSLPPGFHFIPSDEELVVHFLHGKATLHASKPDTTIPSLDLCHCDPWDLEGKAFQGGNHEWYFFCHWDQSRVSSNGYWVALGDEELVSSGNSSVGSKKTLVFYLGQPPQGIKTTWVMHEYHLSSEHVAGDHSNATSPTSSGMSPKKIGQPRMDTDEWVICRVFEASSDSQTSFCGDDIELSGLDEMFLQSLDDDEISSAYIELETF